MHRFKRVHRDYTLDDLLDPELTAHQHVFERFEQQDLSTPALKKPKIMAENPELKKPHGAKSQDELNIVTSQQDVMQLHPPKLPLPEVVNTEQAAEANTSGATDALHERITLKTLKLYTVDDQGISYWNPSFQKFINVAARQIGFHHESGLRALLFNIYEIGIFTGSAICPNRLFEIIPKTVFAAIVGKEGVDTFLAQNNWDMKMKEALIRTSAEIAANCLRDYGLWPPLGASFELRYQLWELSFRPEVLTRLFYTWLERSKAVAIHTILDSPVEYVPRQWLWHLFVVLMEIQWHFDLRNRDKRSTRSGKTRGTGSNTTAAAQQQFEGPAGKCLARDTWADVILNLEEDILTTGDKPPMDWRNIECFPNFGDHKNSCGTAFKTLDDFIDQLRKRPLASFPAVLAQHFSIIPPSENTVKSYEYKGHRSQGALPDWVAAAGMPGTGTRIYRATATSDSQSAKNMNKKRRRDRRLIEKTDSNFDSAFQESSAFGAEEDKMGSQNDDKNEIEGSEGPLQLNNIPEDHADLSFPGAWEEQWQPEKRLLSDLSRTVLSWWRG